MIVLFVVSLALIGCGDTKAYKAVIRSEPTITDWNPQDSFEVTEGVTRVDGFEMGRVIVKRASDGQLFSAMVIPVRNIQIGSVVRIVQIDYMHNPVEERNFLVIR
ncbi:MAG: hypothetical protein A3F15_00950 [Candidatus Wildermuthbacteria bacterium RIFCSPHIGHO2_12_FULL_40_12]|nr:MAG: hypothetical protein A3F15_00950 [Candidatus Wildermuthbacteria bacterium RIFCSPHIGHO2_12_FULL_40_12]